MDIFVSSLSEDHAFELELQLVNETAVYAHTVTGLWNQFSGIG